MTSFYCLKTYKEESSNFLQFNAYLLCERTPQDAKTWTQNFSEKMKMFPTNDFPVYLITKCFMLVVKGFLDSPLYAIHQTCKSSQSITLNVFQDKIPRILKFWCKLNTRRIIETCPFRFLRDYYGDSIHAMFPQFPNHFLPFLMVFLHVI